MSKKDKCACGCGEEMDETYTDLNENFVSDDKEEFCEHKCTCEDCHCDDENKCSENCDCENGNCKCEENRDFLKDLQRVQAEFDNYRKRMSTALGEARQDGFIDAIEQFLPALDSFKMATDMITDKNTLMGIQFIEKGILDTLSKMGVEVIDATGKFNPELHQAFDTDDTADVESGYIVKEAYKGFTYKDRVIRYSQVIVKK